MVHEKAEKMNNGVIDISSDTDDEVITISDDDDEADDECSDAQFKRDLELAKQLSLIETSKQSLANSPVPSTSFSKPRISPAVVQTLKQRLEISALAWQAKRSLNNNDAAPTESKRPRLDESLSGIVKYERKLSSDGDSSDDDLPDLDEQPVTWDCKKSERSRTSSAETDVIEVKIYDDRQSVDQEEREIEYVHRQISYDNLSSGEETDTEFDPADHVTENLSQNSNQSPKPTEAEHVVDFSLHSPKVQRKSSSSLTPDHNGVDNMESEIQSRGSDFPSSCTSENDVDQRRIIFTSAAKNNLANILKRVTTKNIISPKLKSLSLCQQLRIDSQDSDDSTLSSNSTDAGRHFLDIISNEGKASDNSIVSNRAQEEYSAHLVQENQSNSTVESQRVVSPGPNVPNGSDRIQCRRRVRKCSSEKSSQTGIKKYFPSVIENEDRLSVPVSEFALLKPLRIQMPDDKSVDQSLASLLSQIHLNTIDSCFEEGKDFLYNGLQFVSDFLTNYKPTPSVATDVLRKGLIESGDTSLMMKSYRILLLIHQKYPGTVQLDWEVLKEVMDELCIGRGLCNQEPVILLMASLFLQLMVTIVEDELYSRKVCDYRSLQQTFAYKNISYECGFLNLKQVVSWTVCSLTSGEYSEIQENRSRPAGTSSPETNGNLVHEIYRHEIRKILPLLQNLLFLGIDISTRCTDCAKAVATELLKSYKYLPSIKHKKLLIETMKSDLLQYHLLSFILDTYSEDSYHSIDFQMDLQGIFECFFKALRPRYILTPPTTPQSDDEEMNNLPQGADDRVVHFTSSTVEEFLMLLYFVVRSYLSCKKRKTYTSLRRRAYYKAAAMNSLSEEDQRQLKNLPAHLEELRGRLLTLTTELSHDTEQYLAMMLCFAN